MTESAKTDEKKPDEKKPEAKPAEAKIAGVDPAKTHEISKWKYVRPLTACRFDPTGKYAFTGPKTTQFSVGIWRTGP